MRTRDKCISTKIITKYSGRKEERERNIHIKPPKTKLKATVRKTYTERKKLLDL